MQAVTGKVTLLSAGPGDLELLTVKAVKALARADVLLLDDLVNPDIVTLAPRARVIHTGKRGGRRSTSQAFISRLLGRLAQQGREVVRVKGGDALLFGRAGEEIAHLQAHGVEVRIINGVTAACAAGATLNVSLTHRDHCHGVAFVTAHTQSHGEPDWSALARTRLTLVVYMGMARIESVCSGLLLQLPADTPAAVVESASCAGERRLVTTLRRLASAAREQGFASPAIVIVGEALQPALAAVMSREISGRQEPQLVPARNAAPTAATLVQPRSRMA